MLSSPASRSLTPSLEMVSLVHESIRSVSARARGLAIEDDSLLFEDLALDSLDLVAVVLQLQDHFQVEIDPDEIANLKTVGDLVDSLGQHVRAAA